MEAYLSAHFQHILKGHAGAGQFALQEHDNIAIVLVYLFAFERFRGCLCIALFDIGLKSCNLLVDVCNVLLDDEGQFLRELSRWQSWESYGQLTLISTGRSSNRVLRLATGGHEEKRERMNRKRLTLGELGELDGGAADVLCNGGGHARELGL